MPDFAVFLITVGALLLAGLAADLLGRRTDLPRVTLLVALGAAAGPAGLDLLPDRSAEWYPRIAEMALVMVGFLIGGEITLAQLRRHGRAVLLFSAVVVLATAGVVGLGLWLLGFGAPIALVLAAASTSTDPAAVADVVHEDRAEGGFAKLLLGVVAIDDAWGLIVFSLLLSLALALADPGAIESPLAHGAREIAGAVALGLAMGVPLALLTGRIRPGEPTQAEALGGVLLCGGLALWLEISFLLAAMVMGAVVANLARHHTRPFRAIEGIEWPFLALFFLLTGAALELESTRDSIPLLLAYLTLRAGGRLLGGALGARAASLEPGQRPWVGAALLPQAGVAVGMTLVAAQQLPELAPRLLGSIVVATFVFELVGPMLTRRALRAAD